MKFGLFWLPIAALVTLWDVADARVTRVEITRIEAPTFDGRSFGAVGQYEKLTGRIYGEVDPTDQHNMIIADIDRAPRNSGGRVEYETDIMILRPIDHSKGNHKVWYELTNRGSILAFPQLNDATSGGNDPGKAADAGSGFLMRQGYSLLFSGWDTTAQPGGDRFTMKAPIAVKPDGSAISGLAMEEFSIDNGTTTTGSLTYPAATLDKLAAKLTMRFQYQDKPIEVPLTEWDYTNQAGTAVKLADGKPFREGALYEFVYQAKNPVVAGMGFAAIRDIASFARTAQTDDRGSPNPLAGEATAIYTGCVSQPCRTMHDLVTLGFNEDESGKKAIDGIVNWIGGASGIYMNYRFAQPFRTQRQHINRWFPEFQAPFTYQARLNTVTGKTDGRLARCAATQTCPRIFEVNSANEYWAKDMAVGIVDEAGMDIRDEPTNVRSYFMASLPHQGGVGATGRGICQQNRNPLVANAVLRALLVAMDQWVTAGTEPPASRLPRVADGTLVPSVPQEKQGFPRIPSVVYSGRMHTGDLFDFGPEFSQGILTVLPPRLIGTPYPALVPKTDADGNDIAGVRLPEVAAPVATYTGWNLRAIPLDSGDGCDHFGQQIDFAKTKAERVATGDVRPSLEERYTNHSAYVNAVAAAARQLQQDHLLLEEDVADYIKKAQDSSIGR